MIIDTAQGEYIIMGKNYFFNGKELFLYRKEGRILGSEIKKHLK